MFLRHVGCSLQDSPIVRVASNASNIINMSEGNSLYLYLSIRLPAKVPI